MAKRKVVWTKKANFERQEILNYWYERNKSIRFSRKLNTLILESIKQLIKNPNLGRKTSEENTYVIIIRNYLLFYEYNDTEIIIQSIWDGRRNKR